MKEQAGIRMMRAEALGKFFVYHFFAVLIDFFILATCNNDERLRLPTPHTTTTTTPHVTTAATEERGTKLQVCFFHVFFYTLLIFLQHTLLLPTATKERAGIRETRRAEARSTRPGTGDA
jgi:hypothetical protein